MTAGARPSVSGDAQNANATASTLSHALGRRHMKSWMSGATDQAPFTPPVPPTPSSTTPNPAPPVVFQKRGRPRKNPSPEAVDQQHATEAPSVNDRTKTAPPAERLPPSNSTSPQLANIVTDHPRNRSHGNLDVMVFPSPTPSEEDAHHSGLQIQGLGTGQPINIDRFDSHQTPLSQAQQRPLGGPRNNASLYQSAQLGKYQDPWRREHVSIRHNFQQGRLQYCGLRSYPRFQNSHDHLQQLIRKSGALHLVRHPVVAHLSAG
jgi:hypothetical protein